jgi:putative transcriptional regulator
MYQQVTPMAVKFALRKLIARKNMERADAGQRALTQTEIANGSKVSQSVISTLMNGHSRRIDFDTINGLCGFFNISPGDLFDYTPDENR